MSIHAAVRVVLHLVCIAPACALGIGLFTNQLGFNPVETLTHQTGIWSLRWLLAGLAITPFVSFTHFYRVITYRRMLGLYAFFYAAIHFLVFLIFDLSGSFARVWIEVGQRPYITLGFIALVLLIPLAITSTRNWQRRLGANWKRLHWLVYPIGLFATLHFLWLTKADYREPLIYSMVFLLLMAPRIWSLVKREH